MKLSNIVSNGFCLGCGACEGVLGHSKIHMDLSQDGYLRPHNMSVLDSKDDYLINAICPGIRIENKVAEGNIHPIWGPILKIRTGYAFDEEVRRFGSSGGVISALAIYLIETKKVDFVAQISVSTTNPLVNEVQQSRTRTDVLSAAGSRYAPAAPLTRLMEFLETGQRFAVIGKPCDIAAVRNLSKIDKRIQSQIPYLLSFMCAGVPSMTGTYEVLKAMDVDRSKLISFRYRGDGWPGNARAEIDDGSVKEMDYATSWGNILNQHLQFRCKICPDGTGELADIVCADAWYGKDGYPDFNEHEGRSLVITRTAIGEELVSQIIKRGAIVVNDLHVNEIDKMQPYQRKRKQMVLGRLFATILRRGYGPRYKGMGLLKATLLADPVEWLRSAWGTFKRATGEY
ncbi:MAG: Coenzyme F420 hydrogenase/dehydrogenase, beta subunit C-terminal domain [Methylicorpusculum sp.]|uniref:Coenzyme F420 hydrogenase/dehydrogenase, beta subunit C-terminal domain n=1 Tax=Methylicorpusculum sp. TaxID=2713644 RepID=UPI00271BA457|nr:Coenzyme F420 hydrogenase/dehydrogenase, beta subunit C-terminal domain [Methylicorpusculum sp.]MDO8941095.1 Coenzyme F420 hydrogenase/dehydrogenase, beta subunit C-terminal domain [Methylicorpusculum sp.]